MLLFPLAITITSEEPWTPTPITDETEFELNPTETETGFDILIFIPLLFHKFKYLIFCSQIVMGFCVIMVHSVSKTTKYATTSFTVSINQTNTQVAIEVSFLFVVSHLTIQLSFLSPKIFIFKFSTNKMISLYIYI